MSPRRGRSPRKNPRERFRFEYEPPVVRFGTGSIDDLGSELAQQGFERALVVCGRTVGTTPAVIEPVKDGLADRLAGVFAETTPEKRLATAYGAVDAMKRHDADVVVALGGGSSLDVAKVASVLAVADRDREAVRREFENSGTIEIAAGDLPSIVAVPTTLAGADLSNVAGVTATPENGLVAEETGGGLGDPRLMPAAVCYDPELVATTPKPILAASAMNGFDKGIETIYARNATSITDGTAARGLRLLADGLVELGEGEVDADVLEPVVEGILLVQYGISRPDETTLSVVHAFGHGLARTYDVQQGAAHGIVAPRVLESIFEHVDGRRDLLADALGAGDRDDSAAAVVDAVTRIRDALDLPNRLRDVDGPEVEAFPQVAEAILADPLMANAPPGYDPTQSTIEDVLQESY